MDIITLQIQVLRHIKKTYDCPQCDRQIKTAPKPPQILPKTMASPATLVHIVTAKANGIEPYRYLRHVFTELPKATSLEDIEALLLDAAHQSSGA